MNAEKIFSRRKGFSLLELFLAVIIIAIFTSFITANITSQDQTVKAEAEKLAAYITGLTLKADRRHIGFTIRLNDTNDSKTVYWGEKTTPSEYIYKKNPTSKDKVILAPGFSIAYTVKENMGSSGHGEATYYELTYDANTNEFTPNNTFTLTKDSDNSVHYVHIRSGRIRASEVSTDLGADEE